MNDNNQSAQTKIIRSRVGLLALENCGLRLPLQICQSAAGFYIGTMDGFEPCSRESMEYFKTRQLAADALDSGEWTQRDHP